MAITNLKYIDDTAEDYEDFEYDGVSVDLIAKIRSMVNSVSLNY